MKLAVPDVHFMRHDRWANVLFLHWKVPAGPLQDCLQQHVAPFVLDRTTADNDDNNDGGGTVWIGLILLTEQNVGISWLPRVAPFNAFTHHGVNVRTYVQTLDDKGDKNAGIHFASLECDHRFVSHMATYFGMPYQLATMSRQYWYDDKKDETRCTRNDNDNTGATLSSMDEITTENADNVACLPSTRLRKFRIVSQRTNQRNSLWHVLAAGIWEKLPWHRTKLLLTNNGDKEQGNNKSSTKSGVDNVQTSRTTTMCSKAFTVECEWERCAADQRAVPDADLATFLVERYHAYTYKYGHRLVGQVEHAPWPVEAAKVITLNISNIDAYQPKHLQPIIKYMASHAPDSVLYSPGVGPIDFRMLQIV